ncbi:hypothetical protein D3C81_2080050 [compost metagenome]
MVRSQPLAAVTAALVCWAAGASATACSIVSISLLPMTTASATRATRWALSASRMPKPTPTGMLPMWRRMTATRSATSSVFKEPAPVTPLSDT